VTEDTDTEDDRKNRKTKTLKVSQDVGEILADVAKDLPDDKKKGAVREATDLALILWLDAMVEERPDVVEYHSQQEGWNFHDLRDDLVAGIEHEELIPDELDVEE